MCSKQFGTESGMPAIKRRAYIRSLTILMHQGVWGGGDMKRSAMGTRSRVLRMEKHVLEYFIQAAGCRWLLAPCLAARWLWCVSGSGLGGAARSPKQASKGKGACLDYYCNDARTTLNTLAQTSPVHTPILKHHHHHHHPRHALLKAATPTPLPIIPHTTSATHRPVTVACLLAC